MTDTTVRPSATLGVVALLLAVLGTAAMAWSFVVGIDAALDGSGSGAGPYTVVFLIAAAAVVLALILAIVGLVRRRARVLSVITILVALIPIVGVVVLRVAALS
jgi:hypothetical protein